MARARKVAVGPMPSQKDDYSNYEETEILWGRIFLLFGLVFAAAFGVIYSLFNQVNEAPAVVSVIEQRKAAETMSDLPVEKSIQTNEPIVAAIEQSKIIESDGRPTQQIKNQESVVDKPQRAVSVDNEPSGLISPVTTLHPGIRQATLTSNIDSKRRPVDELGYEVLMNEENLIKVVLYTEMQNIRGTTLYHDWTLGEKTHASVKIPVNKQEQASFSSKFIDKHMIGDWTVKVRDKSGELYAMANFKVSR